MAGNANLIFESYEKFWNGSITLKEYHKILDEIGKGINEEMKYRNELLYERFENGRSDEEN